MTANTITAEDFTALQLKRLTEKAFRQHVVDYARAHGWLVYWTWRSDHSPSGFPDLVLCRECVIFAELKTEKGKLTPDQDRWLAALRLCGRGEVYVWRPSMWQRIMELLQ
jgi:hypothetical protein